MKRPSIWPLLVITMVIGNVFALLVFQDRLQTSELQVANTDQTIRQQSNHIQSVERELQEAQQQLAGLQVELNQAIELETTQADQIQDLNEEIQIIQSAEPEVDIAALTENFDNQFSAVWTVTLITLAALVLEFFFIR